MGDPTILFVKPQAIRAKDKKALAEAGVIVIETEDPVNVKLVRAGAELSSTALLGAAAATIKNSGATTKEAFGKAICEMLIPQPTDTPQAMQPQDEEAASK